jgi:SAM-dependent methyltransferase
VSGVVAPDGSPVDVYRVLPRPAEADAIHAAIPDRASILDLGAGVGRFARALAALGHPVVAVDHEPAMLEGLESVAGVEPLVADIVGLALGRRFDVVLLASHLVDDDDLGPASLAVAHAHVEPHGRVIAETYPPGVDWAATVGQRRMVGPVGITMTRARVDGAHLEASVRYDLDGRTWDQPFRTRLLDDQHLVTRLAAAGLRLERWLDRERGWLIARPG